MVQGSAVVRKESAAHRPRSGPYQEGDTYLRVYDPSELAEQVACLWRIVGCEKSVQHMAYVGRASRYANDAW